MAQLVGTQQVAAVADLKIFVGQVTLDGSGDGSIAHGLGRTPIIAFIFSEAGGDASGAAVTADGTDITITGAEASVSHTVVAFG